MTAIARTRVAHDLRTTPLTDRHRDAGAKLGPFAGWSMPIRFTSTLAEHEAVRTDVGLFDVSHLGTVWVEGAEALAVVAATFTNDPSRLDDGASQYSLCCDADGGVVDDLIVYRLRQDRWLTIPNAANTDAVVDALDDATQDRDATVVDQSDAWAVLAVQGPRALEVVEAGLAAAEVVVPLPVADVDHLGVVEVVREASTGLLARTGYTGEAGCELVLPGAWATTVWDALVTSGATPCGLGARDTLRLEMGYPLHGHELSVDTSPYEARLGWAVKLGHAAFRGAEALATHKEQGPSRRLWGLLVDGRRPAREGMEVRHDGQMVGRVTSGTVSPTLGRPVALAYLDDPVAPGDDVEVDIRGTTVGAEVVRPPFVDRQPGG